MEVFSIKRVYFIVAFTLTIFSIVLANFWNLNTKDIKYFDNVKLSSSATKYYKVLDRDTKDNKSGIEELLNYDDSTEIINDLNKLIRSSNKKGKLSDGRIISGTDNGHLKYYGLSEKSIAYWFSKTDNYKDNDDMYRLFYTSNSFGSLEDLENHSVNREHVWCQSLSDGFFGVNADAGNDLHHIRPVSAEFNSARGNRPFKNLDKNEIIHTYYTTEDLDFVKYDGYLSESILQKLNASLIGYGSIEYFEPSDDYKGDIARILSYLITAYKTDLYDVLGNIIYGEFDTIVKWNLIDPVDVNETNRNDVVMKIQGNRNPYIDCPEIINKIWG